MEMIRPSAVAGLFYPAKPDKLSEMIEHDLAQCLPSSYEIPKALIVPHAGYIYSGPIAAQAYNAVIPIKEKIKRVVLIGPSHRVAFDGLALTDSDWYETPLGLIKVDRKINSELIVQPSVTVLEEAHSQEHSLEVQLPFLQYILDDFTIVPIVIGHTRPEIIANVFEQLSDLTDTLFVISSDLSHYLDYPSAKKTDEETTEAILHLHPETIDGFHACGCLGIQGFLLYAQTHHLTGHLLDLRNSGDTAGRKDSVVGYGAYLFN